MISKSDYERKLEEQLEQYTDAEIHDLPPIFHYWSHNYVRPVVEEVFRDSSSSRIYAQEFASAIATTGNTRIASLGPGDGGTEVEIALALHELGVRDFSIELVELSDHLLDRAMATAQSAGVAEAFRPVKTDVNKWRPMGPYAGVMANYALHHFQELEYIFDAVWSSLEEKGVFVSFDTVGRNGHQRWPEALVMTQFFWDQLPDRFKYHRSLKRWEKPWFIDWDCSVEGFEGIRAQDILPLLIQKFGFTKFVGWGGIIDVFVDRGFGPNFDADSAEDRAFIDKVHETNEALLRVGFVKPTQMAAVMVRDLNVECVSSRGLTPSFSVRDPAAQRIPPSLTIR